MDGCIGPNPCSECGGEYGEHREHCSAMQTPTRFRKKPVVVEAEQYNGPISVDRDAPNPSSPPGVRWESFDITWVRYPVVTTIHGQVTAVAPGDWVIREPDGEHYYPCKPDIFAATYEPA